MKHLLIVLMFILQTTLFADSSLYKAFSNGHVSGEATLFSYNIEKDTDKEAYATALGGFLRYATDTNNSFFGSVRFHTSNSIGAGKNETLTSLFNNDKNASSFTTNSEAFLAYKTDDRIIRVGNVMLNTPMMNDDTTKIVPWSYQGFTYAGKLTKHIKVQLNHISKIRSSTSSNYKRVSASGDIGDKGITMLSFHYDNSKDLNIQIYYYYAPELYSTFVFQTDYQYTTNDTTLLCLGMQYYKSGNGAEFVNTESIYGGDDIDLIALRVMLDSDDWMTSLNYSQNFGVSGIVKGYGGLAKVYTTSMIANGRANYKPETWMLKSSYYLPNNNHNTQLAINVTNTKVHDSRGHDFNAVYIHLKQYFTQDTSLYLRYENLNFSTSKSDASFYRLIANFRF